MKVKRKMETRSINSVKTKLISSLLCICLVPLIFLGVFTSLQSYSMLTKKLQVTSEQTLAEIDRGITNYLTAMSNFVEMLSVNYDFANLDEKPEYGAFVQMLLKDIHSTDENIIGVYYGTEKKKFLLYPEEEMGDYDPKIAGWYKLAVSQKGKVVITSPYLDATNGKIVITIAKAVEKEGNIVGVVGLDFALDKLSESMSKIKIGKEGYLAISDSEGIMISNTDKELIGKDSITKLSYWNEMKSKKSDFIKYKDEKENKFVVYTTSELTGWKMVAILPESELLDDTNKLLYTTLTAIIVVALLAIGVSTVLSRGISRNVKSVQGAIEKASQGDLTAKVNIKSKDEFNALGNAFNIMIENISSLMRSVEASSKAVLDTSGNLTAMAEQSTAAVTQVAQAMDEITIGATKQAESTLESATSMDNLSNKLDSISNSTKEMGDISSETQKLSSDGLVMVKELIEISNQTKNSSVEVGRLVEEVNNSMMQITAISDTISQITAKTNLLSLNATIEAARAGESGRGFAVVADEIRKLAEQSKNSTEEIKGIINEIQGKSIAAVEAMNETENVVNEQSQVVNKTEKIFDSILNGIFVLTDKVKEIQYSTEEIQHKKDDVVAQIENVSSISEETASATEEVSASTEEITATMTEFTQYAEQLQQLSQKLEEEIEKFKV
jgi:methyl-accepting chemotaxis protein